MFPEHRELIAQLRQNDTHFRRLFDQHNVIDHKIINMESGGESGSNFDLDRLKKEKLSIKDSIYTIIRKHTQEN